MMTLLVALVPLVTALVGAWLWWAKRRTERTPAQERDDTHAAYREAEAQIAAYEAEGNFAAADALRNSLRDRALAGSVPHDVDAVGDAGGEHRDGKRVSPDTPGWDAVDPSGPEDR